MDENGWIIDDLLMNTNKYILNIDENGWKWMKMDENGSKWMKMDENGSKCMNMDELWIND